MDEARESVAGLTPDALAVGHVRSFSITRRWRGKRVIAGGGEIIEELLDAGFMRDRRRRIGRAGRRFGGIAAVFAMHVIELLGLRVIRLQFVITDRPGG